MKRCIENCEVRDIRCDSAGGDNPLDVGWVVEWGKGDKSGDFCEKIIIYKSGFMKSFPSVDDTVPDGIDLGNVDTVNEKLGAHHLKPLVMVTYLFDETVIVQSQ